VVATAWETVALSEAAGLTTSSSTTVTVTAWGCHQSLGVNTSGSDRVILDEADDGVTVTFAVGRLLSRTV